MSAEENLYKTIGPYATFTMEEKRSEFIGHAAHVANEEEAIAMIKRIRHEHADATHNVYAYALSGGSTARYSDDGEPQGTAGMPVLNVIKMSGVTDVCIVVTRYFGGTLLGAGGLVRAYGAAARGAIDAAGVAVFEPYTELRLTCGYSDYQKVEYELPKFETIIDGTDFGADVTLSLAVRDAVLAPFLARMSELCCGRAAVETVGTRLDVHK